MKPRRLTAFAASVFLYPGLVALAGCAGLPSYSSSTAANGEAAEEARLAQQRADSFRAAHAYEQAASQAQGAQAHEYHLRAAEAAVDGNDYAFATSILDALPPNALDSEQQLRWRLVRSRIALARNDAAGALHLLPADNAAGSPLAERVMLLRGRALFRLGDPVAATQALVQREHLLAPAQIAENRDAIWSGLGAAPLDSAALARAGSADATTRGWVELANLAHRSAPLDQYEGWRQRYPSHPGQERLASIMMQAAPAPTYVQPSGPSPMGSFNSVPARAGFYALLLPQSGGAAAIAESLRAGFSAAAGRAGNGADIKVYEAAGNPSTTLAAYNQALSDGAGVIVGPLLKNDVTAMSQGGSPRIPVLALNYLDAGRPAPSGLYQFGLSPEDEARAAAEDAVARGLRRAVVLVPDNERGSRVQAAFEQRLRELGGEVRDSRRYSGEFKDWSTPISSLLHYQRIDDKKKLAELRAAAQPGVDVQRRNDFDFIFMDAGIAQARQLWPLFRYYHAERMPIYDTAGVHDGPGDQDLAGIRFCDAPWMLDDGGTFAALRGEALAGRRPDQARFYALGDDAFQLALRLSQNSLHPQDQLPGASGMLRVGDDGAVHRGLVCAQMGVGGPHVLETPGAGTQ